MEGVWVLDSVGFIFRFIFVRKINFCFLELLLFWGFFTYGWNFILIDTLL